MPRRAAPRSGIAHAQAPAGDEDLGIVLLEIHGRGWVLPNQHAQPVDLPERRVGLAEIEVVKAMERRFPLTIVADQDAGFVLTAGAAKARKVGRRKPRLACTPGLFKLKRALAMAAAPRRLKAVLPCWDRSPRRPDWLKRSKMQDRGKPRQNDQLIPR